MNVVVIVVGICMMFSGDFSDATFLFGLLDGLVGLFGFVIFILSTVSAVVEVYATTAAEKVSTVAVCVAVCIVGRAHAVQAVGC